MFVSATASAEEAPNDTTPLTLHAAMALGPSGTDGRWGIGVERHPGRGHIGYGVAAGFAAIGTAPDVKPTTGAWIAPVVRPGLYFSTRKDAFVTAHLGVGFAPIVDVLGNGKARLTLSAQPGFLMSVERFAFGLAMMLNQTVIADERGFGVGVAIQIGGVI